MDRRQSEQHAAQILARAALSWPRKCSQGRVSAASQGGARQGLGSVPPFLYPIHLICWIRDLMP